MTHAAWAPRILFVAGMLLALASLRAEDKPEVFDVVLLAQGDSIIQTIKAVREATPGLGLKDAMDLVKGAPKTVKTGASKADGEKLLKAFDALHAKAEMRDAGGKVVATTTVEPDLPGKFDLILKSFKEENKVFVVRIAKDATGLGLDECKKLVESAPVTVKSGLDYASAQRFKRLLEANQAVVEVKESAN